MPGDGAVEGMSPSERAAAVDAAVGRALAERVVDNMKESVAAKFRKGVKFGKRKEEGGGEGEEDGGEEDAEAAYFRVAGPLVSPGVHVAAVDSDDD